jgi:ribosomal protein L11 methyltransferase
MIDYVELTVSVSPRQPGTDLLISELAEAGCESFAETADGFQAWIPEDQFQDKLLSIVNQLDTEVGTAKVSTAVIKGQNWNAEWESAYEPVVIGTDLIIRAPFHPKTDGFRFDLIIQPQQSFGTGHHPTTLLIAEKLLTLPVSARYFIDMGCGTGVLGILASMREAAKVDCVDIEPHAVENAKENAGHNNISGIEFAVGDTTWLRGKSADVVLANINKNVLTSAMDDLRNSMKAGGDLIMSGFFTTDADDLVTCAGNAFQLIEIKSSGEWAMVHLRKNG